MKHQHLTSRSHQLFHMKLRHMMLSKQQFLYSNFEYKQWLTNMIQKCSKQHYTFLVTNNDKIEKSKIQFKHITFFRYSAGRIFCYPVSYVGRMFCCSVILTWPSMFDCLGFYNVQSGKLFKLNSKHNLQFRYCIPAIGKKFENL